MENVDLEELKELKPQPDGLEAYYDAYITVLRATFLRVSEAHKDIQLPKIPPELAEASAQNGSDTAP